MTGSRRTEKFSVLDSDVSKRRTRCMPSDVSTRGCRGAALALVVTLASGSAWARSAGIAAQGCEGCHSSSAEATISLETNPATFSPGSEIEVLATIAGSSVNSGGIYISTDGVGELEALSSEGLGEVTSGLVHVEPKGAQAGQVVFRFGWKAPSTPGAVRFYIYGLGANNNGQRSGDAPVEGNFDRVYGCEGQEYYFDGDGDGFGRSTGQPLLACAGAPPPNYSAVSGDCVDYDGGVFPSAAELCNKKDDDCNGEIDENALPIELWPDGDGDGFYDQKEGEPVVGCIGLKNYAGFGGDCDDGDVEIFPEAEELCDYRDNDCDGEADDRVRPVCGEGWCRRSSTTCEQDDCYPGEPEPERCNYLDDDCDGEVDEGELCAAGEACLAGECVPTGTLLPSGGSTGSGASAGSGTGSAPASGGSGAEPPSGPKASSDAGGCAVSPPRPTTAALWILALLTAGSSLRSLRAWRRGRARRSA